MAEVAVEGWIKNTIVIDIDPNGNPKVSCKTRDSFAIMDILGKSMVAMSRMLVKLEEQGDNKPKIWTPGGGLKQ